MSREIKFRAWHKDHKEMVYFDNEKASKDQFQSSAILRLMAGNDSGILMPFTGMKDSEGKDIYEGDILDGAFYAIVKYSKGGYVVSNKENRHVKGSLSEFLRVRIQGCGRCEVIGNIFES